MDHLLKCHDIVKTDFVRGENCYLYDTQGRRYVDFESGIWCTALGHGHPRINRVIESQLAKLTHLGTRYPNAVVEEAMLAVMEIVGLAGGKGVFLSSGSEAVEFGAQAARRITGRNLLLTTANAYLAAYGSAGRKSLDEWHVFDWQAAAGMDLAAAMDHIPFERLGGFVFEPGGSGMAFVQFPPQSLIQAIVQRIQQAGGLVVANEVTAGMGRTGRWFGFQHYAIQPDIVALGKGLGNGYPVSAVVLRREAAEALERSGFRYAQSHQNDPLGSVVAKEVIRVLREEQWIERGAAVGAQLLAGLQRLAEKFTVVKEARGRGMLLGLELWPHATFSVETAYQALLARGCLVGYYPAGNLLRFDPALTIGAEEIRYLLDCLDDILQGVAPDVR